MPHAISQAALQDIRERFTASNAVKPRVPFSIRFPRIKPAILFTRQLGTSARHALNRGIARRKSKEPLPHRLYRHSSILLRKLGTTDSRLQLNKVKNLEAAIATITDVVIRPGEVFSLWTLVGRPSRRRGFVDGMLLSRGKVIEGLGGGLCQLSNLLHWMFLHGPFDILERYHHSLDVFPDSGRTIPFGSGATILYNFVDLKVRNTGKTPIQIKLWLTKEKLFGELRTTSPHCEGYRIRETDHCFVKWQKRWYRYNRLWRVSRLRNHQLKSELIVTNLAPVLYHVSEKTLREDGHTVIKM